MKKRDILRVHGRKLRWIAGGLVGNEVAAASIHLTADWLLGEDHGYSQGREQVRRLKVQRDLLKTGKIKKTALLGWSCCCPFHGEITPSCIYYPEIDMFNCFGCNTEGDGKMLLSAIIVKSEMSYLKEKADKSLSDMNKAIEELKDEIIHSG